MRFSRTFEVPVFQWKSLRCKRKIAIAMLLSGAMQPIPAMAEPCDLVQLELDLVWARNNNKTAKDLIDAGGTESGVGGANKIAEGYRTALAHNSDALQRLNNCGPVELLTVGTKLAGW